MFGRVHCMPSVKLPSHSHAGSYATVVLGGGYWEAGDNGRHEAEPGDVLLHDHFDAHANMFGAHPSEILNLPLPSTVPRGSCLAKVDDPDRLMRIAERDLVEASAVLGATLVPRISNCLGDWPDQLASILRIDHDLKIGAWAARNGLDPATVSRGFSAAFGMSPAVYRRRQRAQCAWRSLIHGSHALADIAAELGFADQAHMTHDVKWLTGLAPGAWRRKVKSPQELPVAN